jgi:hypothetical protein
MKNPTVNLRYLICEFEDDDDPAHPEKTVNARSLRRAFPKMTKHNADFLIQKTLEFLQAEEEAEDGVTLTHSLKLVARCLQVIKRVSDQVELIYAETKLVKDARINQSLNQIGGSGAGAGAAGAGAGSALAASGGAGAMGGMPGAMGGILFKHYE